MLAIRRFEKHHHKLKMFEGLKFRIMIIQHTHCSELLPFEFPYLWISRQLLFNLYFFFFFYRSPERLYESLIAMCILAEFQKIPLRSTVSATAFPWTEGVVTKWNNRTQSFCRALSDLPNSNISDLQCVEVNPVFVDGSLCEHRKQYILPLVNHS